MALAKTAALVDFRAWRRVIDIWSPPEGLQSLADFRADYNAMIIFGKAAFAPRVDILGARPRRALAA
jgi:hypothetical protein